MIRQKFKTNRKAVLSLLLLFSILIQGVTTVRAATVLPVFESALQESESVPEEKQVIIKDSAVQMVVMETTLAYEEPSDESKAIFSITGGNLVAADINSLSNEYITIEYHDKLCYMKSNSLKAVVGNTPAVMKKIEKIKNKYKFEGEDDLEIIIAPKHYSVAGSTLYYNYQDYLWTLCVQFDIEEYFTYLLCQFYFESGYNQSAVSIANAYGICQLKDTYHKAWTEQVGHPEWDLIRDPYANMYIGVLLMSRYIKSRQNLDLALTDYNAGPGYAYSFGVRHEYTDMVHYYYTTLRALD